MTVQTATLGHPRIGKKREVMQSLKTLQNITLTGITCLFTLASPEAFAADFSGSTFDPGKIDSGIPGFVGDDGLGNVSPNNTVNPVFVDWASGYLNYLPTASVSEEWQTPERPLSTVIIPAPSEVRI